MNHDEFINEILEEMIDIIMERAEMLELKGEEQFEYLFSVIPNIDNE